MELLTDAQLLKTVTDLGPYYPKLVKEFLVNLSATIDQPDSSEFNKVYVRGHAFVFSPTVINDYLGHGRIITTDRLPSMNTVAKEITGDENKSWPQKGSLSSSDLTAKYSVLYMGLA